MPLFLPLSYWHHSAEIWSQFTQIWALLVMTLLGDFCDYFPGLSFHGFLHSPSGLLTLLSYMIISGIFVLAPLRSPGFLRLFLISIWWKNNGRLRNTSCVHLMYREAVIYYITHVASDVALLTSLFFCSNVIDTRCTAVLFWIVNDLNHKHVHYTDVHTGACSRLMLANTATRLPGAASKDRYLTVLTSQ